VLVFVAAGQVFDAMRRTRTAAAAAPPPAAAAAAADPADPDQGESSPASATGSSGDGDQSARSTSSSSTPSRTIRNGREKRVRQKAAPRADDAPLSDNIAPPELSSIPAGPAGKGGRVSSSGIYSTIFKAWWKDFCEWAKWDPVAKLVFIDEAGVPVDNTFRAFLTYCYDNGAGYSTYKLVRASMQCELERQALCHERRPRIEEKYIANISEVKRFSMLLNKNERKKSERIEEAVDIQAELGGDLDEDKMVELAWACLKREIGTQSWLLSFQALAEVRYGHQGVMRHDDMRSLFFIMMFVRDIKSIGPTGMPALHFVSDGGKTNANGNYQYSAFLPHKNPLLCTLFITALCLLERFLGRNEPFPDFLRRRRRSSG
jgi:hypothetical protein